MKDQSDQVLVHQIIASNYAAFSELYNRYWKQLYQIARHKVGKEEDAFDVVQELFTDFWQRRQELKIEKSVDAYLVSALYYKTFMHFRKKGLEEKHLENYAYFLEQAQLGVKDLEEDNELEYVHLVGVVAETIEQMPDKMREVFNLKHRQSLSIAQIAGMLGISTQTVKNQLANAMGKLRKAAADQVPGTSASLFLAWLFS